jgi:hypothetical protein
MLLMHIIIISLGVKFDGANPIIPTTKSMVFKMHVVLRACSLTLHLNLSISTLKQILVWGIFQLLWKQSQVV